MSDSLFFDDEAGELTLTQQTGPETINIVKFHVNEIQRFDYKRPGFFGEGTLQFHLTSGFSTEIISVAKAHKSLFDQLVSALQTARNKPESKLNQITTIPPNESNKFEQSLIFKKETFEMNEFVALDTEWTDSKSPDSVCEIGLAKFVGGELVDCYREYVKPRDEFHMGQFESATHGIDRKHIENASTLIEQWPTIQEFIGGRPLILHQATNDINKLLASIGERAPELVDDFLYLDTMLIAKKCLG